MCCHFIGKQCRSLKASGVQVTPRIPCMPTGYWVAGEPLSDCQCNSIPLGTVLPFCCTCSLTSQDSKVHGVLPWICVRESPWQHFSIFGRFQSNLSGGWRSQQLHILLKCFVKINSQVKRRQVLIDISVVRKAKVWICISLQHLDGRHKAPGFSLVMEPFFHLLTPSPGEALHSERWSWGWFPICSKDGNAGTSALWAQSRDSLFLGPFGWLSTVAKAGVWDVCTSPSGCWTVFYNGAQILTQSTVSGLLSAECLLWSKCLCFQTPSRPVYSFSTWLQDKSVLAVSKGVNAFSKILSETMRIGGTPKPNILLIYSVRAAGKLDILQRNWLFSPPSLLFFFSLKSAAMEWVNYFLGQLLCNIQYFILWAHKNKCIKRKKVASCSVFQRIGQLQRFHVCFLGMC